MKIYVSSHSKAEAVSLADRLTAAGHTVTSRWVRDTTGNTTGLSADAKTLKASQNYQDIEASDALVLISGPDLYPGGKFVEAGYAFALDRTVFVVGRLENLLLYQPEIILCDDANDLIRSLGCLS
jgi:hypothetical protein